MGDNSPFSFLPLPCFCSLGQHTQKTAGEFEQEVGGGFHKGLFISQTWDQCLVFQDSKKVTANPAEQHIVDFDSHSPNTSGFSCFQASRDLEKKVSLCQCKLGNSVTHLAESGFLAFG